MRLDDGQCHYQEKRSSFLGTGIAFDTGMKTLLMTLAILLVSQMSGAATRSHQTAVGKVRGYGLRTVLVEMPSGRLVTVPRSALGRKLKIGGRVSWSRS